MEATDPEVGTLSSSRAVPAGMPVATAPRRYGGGGASWACAMTVARPDVCPNHRTSGTSTREPGAT